jgi:hypothetical protein
MIWYTTIVVGAAGVEVRVIGGGVTLGVASPLLALVENNTEDKVQCSK